MEGTQDLPRRTQALFGLCALGLAAYFCAGLRFVRGESESAFQECRIPVPSTRKLEPGWNLSPPGACRISRYPLGPQDLLLDLPGAEGKRISSREGVQTRVRGLLRYLVPATTSARAHELTKGRAPSHTVGRLASEAIAAEVQRSSFAAISGAHRLELERSLAMILGPELRERGFVLHSLRIDSVRMVESPGRVSREPIPGSRLLVIGLDGADWRILDSLIDQGQLPNLRRLIGNGVRARLKSVEPLLSPVVWTTAATGFLPSEHGILDFLVRDERTGRQVPVTSAHRRVKAIWNLLSESGVSVGVIGWWATWPAERVDGYIVSDRVAYQLFGQGLAASGSDPSGAAGRKTFPEDLFGRIVPLLETPDRITEIDLKRYLKDPSRNTPSGATDIPSREQELKTVLASTRSYEAIVAALASNSLQSFQAIYFEGIDTVSHLFMPFRPPRRPGISSDDFERYHAAVDAFYAYQDEIIGRILERVSGEVGVLVLSDHGFKSDNDRPSRESRINFATAAQWHRRNGILIASGGRFRRGVEVPDISVMDVTPTILAYFGLPVGEDMHGRPAISLFDEKFLTEHPVKYSPSWESGGRAETAELEDPAGDQLLIEKLQSLGYLSREGDLTANNLGNSLLAQGRTEEAIAQFRRAVSISPELPLAHVNLGKALLAKGDLQGARDALSQALRRDPQSPDAALLMASLAMAEGDYQLAEQRLEELLAREPSAAMAHKLLGALHRSDGELAESESDYRRALAVDAEDSQAWSGLGATLRAAGKFEEAESAFRHALEEDPESAGALNNLAVAAMERGDWQEAEILLGRAALLAPNDSAVHNNRGNLFVNRGDLGAAAREYRKALEAQPDHAQALNGLAALAEKEGNLKEAEEGFRRAVTADPRYTDARLNLAGNLARQGRGSAAIRELKEFLDLVSGERMASVRLARLLLDQENAAEARTVCLQALDRNPQDPELWSLQGEALVRLGKSAEAVESFKKSLVLNPFQPDVASRLAAAEGEIP